MRRPLLLVLGLVLFVATAIWIAFLAWLAYWAFVLLASAFATMSFGWLTFSKAALAIVILGLVLARLRPLRMIAIVGPFAIAEVIYVYSRWSMAWDDIALLLATLVAIGQIAWLAGAAMTVQRQK